MYTENTEGNKQRHEVERHNKPENENQDNLNADLLHIISLNNTFEHIHVCIRNDSLENTGHIVAHEPSELPGPPSSRKT